MRNKSEPLPRHITFSYVDDQNVALYSKWMYQLNLTAEPFELKRVGASLFFDCWMLAYIFLQSILFLYTYVGGFTLSRCRKQRPLIRVYPPISLLMSATAVQTIMFSSSNVFMNSNLCTFSLLAVYFIYHINIDIFVVLLLADRVVSI